MEMGFLLLLAVVIGGATTGGLVHTWLLHRRTLRLEYRVADLEERSLTVRNREKAQKRWNESRDLESELNEFVAAQRQPSAAKARRQFANDPVEPEI